MKFRDNLKLWFVFWFLCLVAGFLARDCFDLVRGVKNGNCNSVGVGSVADVELCVIQVGEGIGSLQEPV